MTPKGLLWRKPKSPATTLNTCEPIDRARIFRQFSGDDALPIRLVEHPKIDSLRSTIVEPDRILTFQVGTLCVKHDIMLRQRGGGCMQDVRNALGKLVCRADRKLRRVEIVRKGQLTVLTFESNGTMRITNLPKT